MDVKTKYTTSIDQYIARIDWHQAPTLPDITEALQSVLRSPQYRPDLRLLIVYHATGLEMPDHAVKNAVEAVLPFSRKFKSTAMAVTAEADYDLARRFSAHFLMKGIVSGAFRDEVAAGVWLMGTP